MRETVHTHVLSPVPEEGDADFRGLFSAVFCGAIDVSMGAPRGKHCVIDGASRSRPSRRLRNYRFIVGKHHSWDIFQD